MTQTPQAAKSNSGNHPGGRWPEVRGSVDLAAVATGLLGPAPGRRGSKGRLWWCCPFHEDRNPSFAIEAGRTHWRCFGCGESGDVIDLVRRLNPGMSFADAVATITGEPTHRSNRRSLSSLPLRSRGEVFDLTPSGLPARDALALVESAEARLWTPEGAEALAYLTGRGLTEATIRAARLGWTPPTAIPRASGDGAYQATGVVIPWFTGDDLALAKVRQPDGRRPKYAEAFRHPGRLVCYPDPAAVSAELPLVITEGELDALLLGQELAGLAAVVTLGSASSRPSAPALEVMLASPTWYIATDADAAGDKAADAWPARARRVRPPTLRSHPSDPDASKPSTDWTDLHRHGVRLRRWWSDVLVGRTDPPLYSWDELAALRWGGADDTPGIIV